MWKDSYRRSARKLRVSVTDRCNLRCTYCMPTEPRWLPREDILSYEELARIVRVACRSGVEAVRLTGGEPLLRRGLPEFVSMLRAVPGLRDIAMTTNGIFLETHAQALWDAGLDRLTVSFDSLDPERWARLARRTGFKETLRGMDAAEDAGFGPLKVNVVLMRGINEDEIVRLADWGRRHRRIMRFIEFMPLEGDRIWSRNRLVPAAEIVARIEGRFPLIARPTDERSTAAVYDYADGEGSVGVIASVTRAFCESCDRIRLSADGGFRNCLFAREAADLRRHLRGGASDIDLADIMAAAFARKGPGHLINLPGFTRPDRAMNAIGG